MTCIIGGKADEADVLEDNGVITLSGISAAFRIMLKAVRTRARMPRLTGVVNAMAVRLCSTSSAGWAAAATQWSCKETPTLWQSALDLDRNRSVT